MADLMVELDETKAKVARTYNATADYFDDHALRFWDRFGQYTVDRTSMGPGDSVLDVCSGAGGSALPAAARVSPTGRVLAIDLAENLLQIAREKSQKQGLTNVEFRTGDVEVEAAALPSESFDGVICVFGIFFFPDIPKALAELWRCVRPGGELAITTWGPQFCEPGNSVFWESIQAERPDLHKGFNPWDEITEPRSLGEVMTKGGIDHCEIVAEETRHRLHSPSDWWKIILGAGYRGTVEQLDAPTRERVRKRNIEFIEKNKISEIETNVVLAIARKPF